MVETQEARSRGDARAYDRYLRGMDRSMRQKVALTAAHLLGQGLVAYMGMGSGAGSHALAALYPAARVFCLPSLYEPYGLVLLEAMAHGRPCVGTTVQAIPEILHDGRAGLLVEPGDPDALAQALVALLFNDALARSLGAAGRRFVESELNWDRVAERMAPAMSAARR